MIKRPLFPPVVTATVICLLFALSLGVVYGDWSQTIQVAGTVSTGEVAARWIEPYEQCLEYHTEGSTRKAGELYPNTGSSTIVPSLDPSLGNANPSLLLFSAVNTYPGYWVKCTVDFENSGSLPWTVRGYVVRNLQNLTGCSLTSSSQYKILDCTEARVSFYDGILTTANRGDILSSSFEVLVKGGAPEVGSYGFQIQICMSLADTAFDHACDGLLIP